MDCGLTAKETAARLQTLGVEADSIDAIVVSHEHCDHVAGIRVFSARHQVKVYATALAYSASHYLQAIRPEARNHFVSNGSFAIQSLAITPFRVNHDAVDPVGFRISSGSSVMGIVTDLGVIDDLARRHTGGLDGLILESNHDPKLLEKSSYPWTLKERIRSRSGHLSNGDASAFVRDLAAAKDTRLQLLVAAHLSEKNNTPDLASAGFYAAWEQGTSAPRPEIAVAGVRKATRLYCLT